MTAASNALLDRYPALNDRLPWVSLGVERTPLTTHGLGGREVMLKRDDLAARPYGGNKVRKLEFLLARARAEGATRIVTAGATGSHHALATTIYGRRLGFDVTTLLFPQHRTDHVRDVLLCIADTGADLRFLSRMEMVPYGMWRARRALGDQTYLVPPGGSDATGTLGYVAAALELDEQIGAGPEPDAIYVAAGTLGTVAGIALGLALAGRTIPVRGVRITSRLVTNRRMLRRLLQGAAALLERAGVDVGDAPMRAEAAVRILDDQVGAGYGHETEAGVAATRRFADLGITLDPTYTAKAAAAVLSASDSRPLFWHTLSATMPPVGAMPALPAAFAQYLSS
ncbi:MAG TPA: pyridoxal-phosphate dependent enzyme [Longimicrobiales bacterium]|nr:pyridoxal-phosphate dependent enzyme [Longimicrobiales bacterium]